MRVELWCRPMRLSPNGDPSRLELLFVYEDEESVSAEAAAERAWTMSNAHPELLSGWMQEARRELASTAPGRSLGVGDVVVASGMRLRCSPSGFVPA